MAVTVTASVLTTADPRPAQVVVAGMASGDVYTVVGTCGDFSWPVPGGTGVADGTSLILIDNRAPFNGDIVYVATVNDIDFSSSAIAIAFSGYAILQNLSGSRVVPCEIASSADERGKDIRSAVFSVSGRTGDQPGRYDTALAAARPLRVEVSGSANLILDEMTDAGGALVLRNDVSVTGRGIPPVEILAPFNAKQALIGAAGWLRVWDIAVRVVGDPEPGIVLIAFDWDYIDALVLTWDAADALALTWDEADVYDWGQLA